MRPEELPKTDIWNLFEKCRNYNRQVGMYSDTDRNYRMYNGNQWAGLPQAPKKSIEPIQLNIIQQFNFKDEEFSEDYGEEITII